LSASAALNDTNVKVLASAKTPDNTDAKLVQKILSNSFKKIPTPS
jgi:hypothetical protein